MTELGSNAPPPRGGERGRKERRQEIDANRGDAELDENLGIHTGTDSDVTWAPTGAKRRPMVVSRRWSRWGRSSHRRGDTPPPRFRARRARLHRLTKHDIANRRLR